MEKKMTIGPDAMKAFLPSNLERTAAEEPRPPGVAPELIQRRFEEATESLQDSLSTYRVLSRSAPDPTVDERVYGAVLEIEKQIGAINDALGTNPNR